MALLIRTLVSMLFAAVLYAGFFVGPSWYLTGSPWWTPGWIMGGTLWGLQLVSAVALLFIDKGLLEERTSVRPQGWKDQLSSGILFLSIFAYIVAISFDVHRWQLLPALPGEKTMLHAGLALLVIGFGFILWVMRVNSFAATTVKVQEERGQYVVDTGPYALVRHPMYLGFMPVMGGIALGMGSTAIALAIIPVTMIFFMPRMLVEEATLKRDLQGYAEYMQRKKHRLIPGIF